ncbi:hypothetical protein TNCV_121261 [Trichonephila clavipes]|nr:hypothetical protein TNCV_121261 [Trichonephila clavipes]
MPITEGLLCGAENTGIGETMNGDEYSLQMRADSVWVAILIAYSSGESGEAAIIPRTSLKGTCMEVKVFSFGEASCFVVVQTFTSSTQVQSTGPVIVTRFFSHMCVF